MGIMNIPPLKCKIEMFSSINPSEDPSKVESSILNIFPYCKINIEKFSVREIKLKREIQNTEITSLFHI